MIRFLIASILLHTVFYLILAWKKPVVIDDPIVSVALVDDDAHAKKTSLGHHANENKLKFSEKKTSSASSSAKAPQPATNSATKDESELKKNLNISNAGGSGENTSGTVSVKPQVLRQFKADYPAEAKNARVEGAVKLSVLIDTTGKVQDVTVLEGPGYGLNETAQAALRKFIFSPAEKLGQKVPVRIVYVYRFRLESR